MMKFKKNILLAVSPIILLFAHRIEIDWKDRITYLLASFLTFGPIAYLLKIIAEWYWDNQPMANGLVLALFINMATGVYFHVVRKTFCWSEFWRKNFEMWAIAIATYMMFEILHRVIGSNDIGGVFKMSTQVMVLLFPISKFMKNIFILTDGSFPAEKFMKRLYDFEKSGDLRGFIESRDNNNIDNIDD